MVDPEFAKNQLMLFTRDWDMKANGEIPAHEWNFSDVNPPVQHQPSVEDTRSSRVLTVLWNLHKNCIGGDSARITNRKNSWPYVNFMHCSMIDASISVVKRLCTSETRIRLTRTRNPK
jgi:hypothetical protein